MSLTQTRVYSTIEKRSRHRASAQTEQVFQSATLEGHKSNKAKKDIPPNLLRA